LRGSVLDAALLDSLESGGLDNWLSERGIEI
jgi:hypothetical protein